MEHYIIIKAFPNAAVGTEVIWEPNENLFKYKIKTGILGLKEADQFCYIPKEEVINNTEYFVKSSKYPEHYSWTNPVFSRKDIYELLDECIPNKTFTDSRGTFSFSASTELLQFRAKLRELGKRRAEAMLDILDVNF